jgi:Domain of unknown function (DUF4360)
LQTKPFIMFNKLLPLMMILSSTTTMVWGRLHDGAARDLDHDETFVVEDPEQSDEAPFYLDEEATYFGSGCPSGSVKVIQADDGSTISVLFSEFEAVASGATTRDRRSCNMAVPVTVAPGFSCGIFKVDYRGFADVPRGSGSRKPSARFDSEYFFAGERGPRKSRSYSDGTIGPIFESDSVGAYAWSPCGGSTIFRINTSLQATKPSRTDEDVSITLDSKDITQDGFHYYFRSRRC